MGGHDANDAASGLQSGISHSFHHANIGTAVNQRDIGLGQQSAHIFAASVKMGELPLAEPQNTHKLRMG